MYALPWALRTQTYLVPCRAGQLSAIVESISMVWDGNKRETEWSCPGHRDISEEVKLVRRKLRLDGLIVKQGHGDGWVWSAARAHVLGSWPCFIRGLC